MRIVSWNCNNGINQEEQINYLLAFSPDVAVLPELKEANIEKLAPDAWVWHTNNHSQRSPKGLGVLAFNGYRLTELPRDAEMEIFIPVKVTKKALSFNLLAVWNFYWACKQGRFKGLKGPNCLEFAALEHYRTLFRDPALIAGDWNLGPTFAQSDYRAILNVVGEGGLRSLYHEWHGLSVEESKHPTFRSPQGKYPHHLDHMFGSKAFYANMHGFEIDAFENVVLSDHAPLILDVAWALEVEGEGAMAGCVRDPDVGPRKNGMSEASKGAATAESKETNGKVTARDVREALLAVLPTDGSAMHYKAAAKAVSQRLGAVLVPFRVWKLASTDERFVAPDRGVKETTIALRK